MSDYEGEDTTAGGWEPVSFNPRNARTSAAPRDFIESVAPTRELTWENLARDFAPPERVKSSLRPQTAKSFQPVLQNIQPRAHHGTGGRPVERPFEPTSRLQDLEALKLFRSKPDDPSDVYELDVAWRDLIRVIPENAELKSRDIARLYLDNISVYSEAFVRTPEPHAMKVEIWGNKEQCQNAKSKLQAWETHLRLTGPRKNREAWPKTRAYDGRKVDRELQQQWQQLEDQAFQDEDDSIFEYEAYLIWPTDYDLDAYLSRYEENTLKEISKQFQCRFRHDRKARPRHTKVLARSEGSLLSAYQRLINLAKEMITFKHRGMHGNFCHLPLPENYRTQVDMQTDGPKKPYIPVLVGSEKAEDERDGWLNWMKVYHKENRRELKRSLDTFIKSSHMSQCHLRLRVSFGDLLFRQFARGPGGQLMLPFNDFLAMLQNQRTELTDPVLHDAQQDLPSLVDRLTAMGQFNYPVEQYRHIFEFKGTDHTNRLRLEIEMQPGRDFEEPQVCSQRWLTFKTFGRNENVLGLKMVDFERPGYMIRADSYDLFTNDSTIKDMDAFRSAVSFTPVRDGMKAFPKLKSTFPAHSKLVSVTEYTSVKLQFKDTNGIVEVQREDTYMQDTGAPSKLPNSTKIELFYYYPEWDTLLGDFSIIEAGQDVSWSRELATFFPAYIDPDRPRSLPKGFKNFMKELYEIQELLKEALSSPDDSK